MPRANKQVANWLIFLGSMVATHKTHHPIRDHA